MVVTREVCRHDHESKDDVDRGKHMSIYPSNHEPRRHCVITGAADGIGRALAHRFAEAGYAITGIDLDEALAQRTQTEVAQRGPINFVMADLSLRAGQRQVVQTLKEGPDLDVLIHNAGINAFGHFVKSDIEGQKKVIALNLIAPMQVTAGLLEYHKLASPSLIIFISSLSHYVSYPGAAVYAGSKDGLAAYARSLFVALAKQNIHVLTVYPGPVRTMHARRHSPDNRGEHKRMPAEVLAAAIYQAAIKRQRTLIPSLSNKVFALAGHLFPLLTERVMKKSLLDKI